MRARAAAMRTTSEGHGWGWQGTSLSGRGSTTPSKEELAGCPRLIEDDPEDWPKRWGGVGEIGIKEDRVLMRDEG